MAQSIYVILHFHSINHFEMNINDFNALIYTLFSYIFCEFFFYLTTNGYDSFDLKISSFNKGLFFTFQISQLHLIYFCFFVLILISKLLPYIFSSFLIESFASPLMLTSLLPSTFWGICVLIASISSSLKFLLLNEDPCNPNCGSLHDIQGKFWLHCWVSEPLLSCQNYATEKKIIKKISIRNFIYFSDTYNKLHTLRLLSNW